MLVPSTRVAPLLTSIAFFSPLIVPPVIFAVPPINLIATFEELAVPYPVVTLPPEIFNCPSGLLK